MSTGALGTPEFGFGPSDGKGGYQPISFGAGVGGFINGSGPVGPYSGGANNNNNTNPTITTTLTPCGDDVNFTYTCGAPVCVAGCASSFSDSPATGSRSSAAGNQRSGNPLAPLSKPIDVAGLGATVLEHSLPQIKAIGHNIDAMRILGLGVKGIEVTVLALDLAKLQYDSNPAHLADDTSLNVDRAAIVADLAGLSGNRYGMAASMVYSTFDLILPGGWDGFAHIKSSDDPADWGCMSFSCQ